MILLFYLRSTFFFLNSVFLLLDNMFIFSIVNLAIGFAYLYILKTKCKSVITFRGNITLTYIILFLVGTIWGIVVGDVWFGGSMFCYASALSCEYLIYTKAETIDKFKKF